MSSPSGFQDFLRKGSVAAARSGLYPNSHQPGGHHFDVPAVATASTRSTQGTTTPTIPPHATNTVDGSQPNAGPVTTPSSASGNNVAATTARSSRPRNRRHNSTATSSSNAADPDRGDNVSAVEHSILANQPMNGVSNDEPTDQDVQDAYDAESSTTPVPTSDLSTKKPKKAATKRKRSPADQSPREPRPKPPVRKAATRKATTQAAPKQKATRRSATTAKAVSRKTRTVDTEESEVEISGADHEETEAPKVKGSGQALTAGRFATRDYVASQSLAPPTKLFKPTRSTSDLVMSPGGFTETPSVSEELLDLLESLPSLRRHLGTDYFNKTLNDTRSIDRKIVVGFKIKQDKEEDETEECLKPSKPNKKKDQLFVFKGLNTNLKPMDDIGEIFDDLTLSALKNGLPDFLKGLGSAKLKVSTLCSGTESPLLAMQMIQESLEDQPEYRLQLEHQFSCEIEPFKQAYIQRNFRPAILFRDVLELKGETAHTAFGAEEYVPNDADIMIAGSSCIDYSSLNSKPKEFGKSGESYETLMAAVDYAKGHRPNIVILENVFKFPWGSTERLWHEAGYATKVAYLDSKDFYLPQTRKRGYMIGLRRAAISERNVDLDADVAVKEWFAVLGKLQRRASSPFTDFTFADDDVQLQKYNRQTAMLLMPGKNTPWDKCRVECLSYRSCNFLGFKKPVTEWENNSSCIAPDSCNSTWFKRQVERIWDTVEINHLRSLSVRCYDMAYKCRCIDLSQSCVRENDLKQWGLVGCITPTANPYFTYRGGPMIGAEALSLQGIPREKLILNRESSKQLIDLSGNAMTTTTVGACILAALISCSKLFRQPPARRVKASKALAQAPESNHSLEYDPNWLLTKKDLTMDLSLTITIAELRTLTFKSARLCPCESPNQILQHCSQCGHTSCRDCGRKPEHKYEPISSQALIKRTSAVQVEALLRKALPPRLTINRLLPGHNALASRLHSKFGAACVNAVEAAAAEICQLVSIKRDRGLSVVYESRFSRLVLTCQPKWDSRLLSRGNSDELAASVNVQWSFYAKPGRELAANSPIREYLSHPIARLTCSDLLFEGQWEVRTPADLSFDLEVVGTGPVVESWEKKQGLEDPSLKDRFVWSVLELRVPSGGSNGQSTMKIPERILGSYKWLANCGTACGSLHVKKSSSDTSIEEPVFLFLDPAPLGNASFDSFVFADTHHKLGLKDVREVLAVVDPGWRPQSSEHESSLITCKVQSQWVPANDARLEQYAQHDLQNVYLHSAKTPISINSAGCEASSLPMIWCEFGMETKTAQELGLKRRRTFYLVKDQFALKPLDWLLKTAARDLQFDGWQSLPLPERISERCEVCAPTPPGVVWKVVLVKKGYQIRPFENVKEACDYERNVKSAPEAVTAELSYDDPSGVAALKITFNIQTLVHKAVANLAESRTSISGLSTIHWRAVVDHAHDRHVPFPQSQLEHCQHETPARQPPSFGRIIPGEVDPKTGEPKRRPLLNKFQIRSLTWMMQREEDGDQSWDEQEIVEAFVAPMNLRLEAKVTARRNVKGGVLADDVGYGKTALVIALIDYHLSNMKPARSPKFANGVDDTIKLKATLILAPPSLTGQWADEIVKFVGDSLKVHKLTKDDIAKNSSVSDFQDADIVLASYELFDDDYFAHLACMSRAPHTPVSSGRGFEEWFRMAQEDLKTLVKASDGLQTELFSSAWNNLTTKKYDKFLDLSKRNKKGRQISTDDETEPSSKKARIEIEEFEEIEIQVPAKPILLIHAFSFERIVIDEFTYLDAKQNPAVLALQAPRRWILSGTPPDNTFEGVSSMARFIGTSIGIPDDAALRYQKVKDSTTKDISGGEELRSYEACHTANWYEERYGIAKQFLKVFVRKNTTLLDGIKKYDDYQKITLAALERALYFEVSLVIMNQGVKKAKQLTKKTTKAKLEKLPIRTKGILQHIAASALPQDALVTACSTMPEFATERPDDPPCHAMIEEKTNLIVSKEPAILSELRGAFWIMTYYHDEIQAIPDIYNYLRALQENRFGDATVRSLMECLVAHAEETQEWTVAYGTEDKKPKGTSIEKRVQHDMRMDPLNEPHQLSLKSRTDDLKLRADTLTSWTIVLVDLVRERRFFMGIRSCLSYEEISCSFCGRRSKDYSTMLFMGRCGHAGCKQCFERKDRPGVLLDHCLDQHCGSKTLRSATVDASDLTAGNYSTLTRQHGSKMVEITKLLLQVTKKDKVLVFVQFPRIITALKAILVALGIQFADGTETHKKATENVEKFKTSETCHVCILQLDTVGAAGWNLQNANRVIFVSSLVTRTQHEYKASMTQAIGRVLRMGQEKDVHVHYFLAEKTVDVDILEERTGRVVVERGGDCLLLREEETEEEERHRFGGLPWLGTGGGEGGDSEEEGEDEDEDEE